MQLREFPDQQDLLHAISFKWQHLVMAHKAGLCLGVQCDSLKKVAVDAKILEKEGLENIEDLEYKPCVGKVMRECFSEADEWQNPQFFFFAECYEWKLASCNERMLQAYIAHGKAFRKFLTAGKNY